ncbi:Gfo/Idh/MocA family protein [Negadavirga shengliensis]|uniref:Gfo/Idh/MocA family protein n=1 Tax=Negadavirga shengliensis TaxID=1389218 RepID=A0ABV9T328_9BACT
MIRAGIIGLGKMGISHCAILGAHPDVDLVGVCDTSALVMDVFKKYSPYPFYADYKKMIEKARLDCLVIASPTKHHAEMVAYALDHGIHVFCEKPFVLDVEEGIMLAKKAESKGLVNQVGYHNRFLGTFNEVKRLLNSDLIGEVYHFMAESYGPVVLREKGGTWRSEKGQGGGCLYDYASHTIDLVHFLLGKSDSVSGTLLKSIYSKGVEDAVYSSMALESGITGQLSVNWSDETHRKMNTQITILGKKGKLIADATEVKIYLKEEHLGEGLRKGWTVKYLTDLTENVDYYLRGEEYSSQLDHFIACVQGKEKENKSSFESAGFTDALITKLLSA